MKKITTILLIMISVFSIAEAKKDKTITVYHTNDTHSQIYPYSPNLSDTTKAGRGGFVRRVAFFDLQRKQNPDLLLFDSGDFSQGSPYFTMYKGDVEVGLMNLMGYDAVAIGNHEFDFGLENMARLFRNARFAVVCANYDFSKVSLSQYVKPYTILKKAGMRIGIIGLMPDITILVSKEVSDMIPGYENSEVVNKWAEYLKTEKKCDLVIALTHIGFENESYLDQMLVRRTRNVDLVVGGHSHTYLKAPHYEPNLDGVPVPIVQDGEWGLNVGNLKISR